MVEEKVYCRYVREHSQRQRHQGEARVDMTRLSHVRRGERREGRGGEPSTVARSPHMYTLLDSIAENLFFLPFLYWSKSLQ